MMEWTQAALYTAAALLGVVLLCWLGNLILVLRKKEASMALNRIMYLAALAAVAINAVRSAVVYSEKTMLAANIVVLVCLIVAFVRTERVHKYGEPQDPESGEED